MLIRRILLTVVALLGALSAAQAAPCPDLPAGVALQPVTLGISPAGARRPTHIFVRGWMRLPVPMPDAAMRRIGPPALCRAAIGEVSVDDIDLCGAFGPAFGVRDRIQRAGARVSFEIHVDIVRQPADDVLRLRALPSPGRCAPQATFLITGSADREITAAPLLADRLTGGGFYWTEAAWGPGSALQHEIGLRALADGTDGGIETALDEPTMVPPRSWTAFAKGEIFTRLQEVLWVPAFVLVILGGFMLFGGALLYARAEPPLAGVVSALTAAVALYVGARWTASSLDFVRLFGNTAPDAPGGWADALFTPLALDVGYDAARLLAAAVLVAPATLLLWIASARAGSPRPGAGLFRHFSRLVLRVLATGSTVALLFLLVAATGALTLPVETPFEPVALVVSIGLAFWAVSAFAPVTGFDWRKAALAALALALMLLYPQPVVHSTGEPPSAIENAMAWFPFAGGYFIPTAMLLTVALVAALKIAGSKPEPGDQVEFDRTMLFLFGFSVTLGSIGSLTSAVLFLAVLWAGDRLIFPREGGSSARAADDDPPRQVRPGRLALALAVIAAAVFWLQYSGEVIDRRSGPPGLLVPALLIYAAAVPAAIGGLLLQHSYDRLPGPIAAAKALVITAFALAASAATRLPIIFAERSILPAVINVLGIFTALIAVAILLYDGPAARREVKGKSFKERLSATSFGWVLTILSSVSLAAASALSPILFAELGTVFRSVVRDTIGRAPQADATPTQPPAR